MAEDDRLMKITKSELFNLIKEEIMSEMDGLTMMDDPYDDDAVPAGMEQGGAMDQVAKEIDHMIIIQMDDVISMLSNYLVTSGASRDPRRAAAMGMEMLHDAGLAFPDQRALERMIAPDDDDEDMPMMQEGMENITPEMDQLAEQMENAVLSSMDMLISMISNFLVTTQGYEKPTELMREGMQMLHQAGFREPDASVIEKMIKDEMDSGYYDTTYYADGEGVAPMPTDDRHLREGMENITPENIGIVFEALGKMAPMIAAMGVPAFIVMLKEFYDERKGGRDGGEM
jgi:hypothetical protein